MIGPSKGNRSVLGRGLMLLAGVGIGVAITACSGDPRSLFAAKQAAGAPESKVTPSLVHALAHLEPASGLTTVGVTPGMRIEKILVSEGQVVKAGDVLAILDGADTREQQLKLAQAQKSAADFQRSLKRDELKVSREQFDKLQESRIPAQQELITILDSSLKTANSDLARMVEGAVPAQQQSAQQLLINETRAKLIEAKNKLRELEIARDLLPSQRQLEDRGLDDRNPENAVLEEQIDLARSNLEQTKITAPTNGKILKVIAHAGEVSTGSLLYMGDTDQMVAIAEVYQSDAGLLETGDRADVTILGKTVPGVVDRIGTIVAQNKLVDINPIARADRRVVEVRIALEKSPLASRYVNIEVDATLHPNTQPGK